METRTSPFAQKLAPLLRYVEIGGLLLSAVGLALHYQDTSTGGQIVMIGFTTVAVIYYLYAFTRAPQTGEQTEASPKGFLNLFSVIVRKVSYIGCSVCVIAWLFEILHLHGAREMMMIGAATLALSSLFCVIYVAGNSDRFQQIQGFVLRGVPLLAVTAYWLYLHPSVAH